MHIIIELNITEDDIIKARRPILYLTRNLNSINHNQLTRSHSPYASTLSRGTYIILYGFVIGGSTSDTQSHTHCCGVAAPRAPYINTAECGLNWIIIIKKKNTPLSVPLLLTSDNHYGKKTLFNFNTRQ